MPEPTRDDWARLAAFIDGEGCIGVAIRNRANYRQHVVSVDITNTDIRLMHWLKERFGGRIDVNNREPHGNRKIGYRWQVRGKAIENILRGCLDLFIMKREQAETALALRETFVNKVQQHEVSLSTMEFRDELKAKLHVLNKRGKTAVA